MGTLDDLMESDSWIIPKILFANLWKPLHDVIIILVPSDSLNLETLEEIGKNDKKLNIFRTKTEF